MGSPISLKIAPLCAGSAPISNTQFSQTTLFSNLNGMSIGSAVFAQLTALDSLYFTMGRPFATPSKLSCPMGVSRPHLMYSFLDPLESTSKTASRSVQLFLHSCRQSTPILYNGPPFPVKIAASYGGSLPSTNT